MSGVDIVDDLLQLSQLQLLLNSKELQNTANWDGEQLDIIQRVVLCDCRLQSLPNILVFVNIMFLNVSFNQLSDIDFVKHFVKLTHLDVSHNKVLNIDGLLELTKLETLRIQNNQIVSLDPLRNYIRLRELNCEYNKISWTDLKLLRYCPLKILSTSYNKSCDEQIHLRDFLVFIIPTLVFLNGHQINNESASSALAFDTTKSDFLTRMYETAVSKSNPNSPSKTIKRKTASNLDGEHTLRRSESAGNSSATVTSRGGINKKGKSTVVTKLTDAISRSQERSLTSMSDIPYVIHIKYGEGNSAPSALAITAEGCGFLRWSRKSSIIACEFDTHKLIAHHTNGNLAFDFDRVENCCIVSDELGCALFRIEKSSAFELNKTTGDILHSYTQSETDLRHLSNFSTSSEGLNIEFDMSTWCLRVKISTELVEIEADPVAGIRLIRQHTGTISTIGNTKKKKKVASGATTSSTLEGGEHEAVRSEAQSVLLQLDEMLKNLTTKGLR